MKKAEINYKNSYGINIKKLCAVLINLRAFIDFLVSNIRNILNNQDEFSGCGIMKL